MSYHLPQLFVTSCLAITPLLARGDDGQSESRRPTAATQATTTQLHQSYTTDIQPLLQKHCYQCHGDGTEIHGEVDFRKIKTPADVKAHFELWGKAVELVRTGAMPPEDQPRLDPKESKLLEDWYQDRLVATIKAKPGVLRPRRLSAHEYRQTLKSLFGFDLEVAIVEAEQTIVEKSLVMKLLPLDPPGPSGFKNDTSANPLTTNVWDQYSFLIDDALEHWFDANDRQHIESVVGSIEGKHLTPQQAETVLRTMVRRAYRRAPDTQTLATSIAAIEGKHGKELDTALRMQLKSVLMSPPFIYRSLLASVNVLPIVNPTVDPTATTETAGRVDEHELAERLSYFLWGDMPDEQLLKLAQQGKLSHPKVYTSEIDRMLADPKAMNLATNFGAEWFSLNEISKVSNNPPVSHALRQQPIDFLHYLFSEGRPLLELIDSNVAFVNPHTAKFYPQDRKQLASYKKQRGIEVEAVANQRLDLVGTPERGGLLTMPGILAMNKGPVLRGTWMLERIMGEHLPDPPADVGQVQPNQRGEDLSFRERFELHRSNATCAVCNDKIDPLGFALQAYDASGNYNPASASNTSTRNERKANKPDKRKKDQANQPDNAKLDTSGRLPSGETFDDYSGLQHILVNSQRRKVIDNIVKRTLSYALCRKLEIHDIPTVNTLVSELDRQGNLDKQEGSFHDLIHLIANSLPFTHATIQHKTNH